MDLKTAPRISVFDSDLNYIGRISLYESVIYNRNFQTYDDFQITLNKSMPELFEDGNYIIFNDDPTRSGIMKRNEDTDETYIRNSVISGMGLFYLFYDRITVPPAGQGYRVFNNEPVEDIIYKLVKENCIDDAKRRYSMLKIGESKHRGGNVTFQTRYKVLSDEITALLKLSGLGIRMTLDPDSKTIFFEVVEGVDHSRDNGKNESYIFSKKFSNVSQRQRTFSAEGAKTIAYVAGQGEGENREILIINDNLTDMDRKEVFIDARDIEQGEDTALEDRGRAKLGEYKATDSTEFEVSVRDYLDKWDLGDMVTFYDKDMDFVKDDQIVSVQETFEQNVFGVQVTFGEPVKTLASDVSSNTEDIKTENRTSVDMVIPNHAKDHLPGGSDALPIATDKTDGLFSKEDKQKLDMLRTNQETDSAIANAIKDKADNKVFTQSTNGLVPAPKSNEGRFLSDDGTWKVVQSGGEGVRLIVSETEPESPKKGDVWI